MKNILAVALLILIQVSFMSYGEPEKSGMKSQSMMPMDKSIQQVIDKIRMTQGLDAEEEIDCQEVTDMQLEELGDTIMSARYPEQEDYQFMVRIMGGKGSETLKVMYRMMGVRRLGCGLDGMMGRWDGMGMNKGMGCGMMNDNQMKRSGGCMMDDSMGMMHGGRMGMMGGEKEKGMIKSVIPTADGGLIVVIGNMLQKYDKNLMLKKEVVIDVDLSWMKTRKGEKKEMPMQKKMKENM